MKILALKPDSMEARCLASGERLPLRAGCLGLQRESEPGYRVERGVAVVRVYGVLGTDFFAEFMGTPTVRLAEAIDRAAADPDVQAVLLEIDSPGGQVSNLHRVVTAIRACGKPVVAYASDSAYSGGYWVASQADLVLGSPTMGVGSIGATMAFFDVSKADAKNGVRVVHLSDPPSKSDFGDGVEIDDAMIERGLDEVREVSALFRADVAAGRGVDEPRVRAWSMAGRNAGSFVGAQAVAAGLVDGVCTPDEAIDKALALAGDARAGSAKATRTTNNAASRRRSVTMSATKELTAMTPDEMEKDDPEQYEAFKAHFKAKFKAEDPEPEPEKKPDEEMGARRAARASVDQLEALIPEGTPDREKTILACVKAGDSIEAAQSRVISGLVRTVGALSARAAAAGPTGTPAGVGKGQPPVAENKADGAAGGGDFMAVVQQRMAEKKIDASAALKQIKAEQPALWAAYAKGLPTRQAVRAAEGERD